ncbi:MAG: FTR1 family protein [Alphaproteobacteria bacterium]|nr:FTR1 family protein [Alphaproteobacteria bacterium]
MIAALIIVFREVLEAALIVSIVLSSTRGLPAAGRWVSAGIAAGVVGAAIVARFAGLISDTLNGYGQEIFNAGVLLLAVVMLAWHTIWMSSHGRQMVAELRTVGDQVRGGGRPLYALAIIVGLAVLREGSETVLFLYGLAASDGGFADAMIGGAAGLVIGVTVGAVLYLGLLRVPTRHIFSVTNWMIILLAAGMAAQAMNFLAAAGLVSLGPQLWDSSSLLSEGSIPGKILHTLVGYMDHPAALHLIVYLATIVIIGAATWMVSNNQHKKLAAR